MKTIMLWLMAFAGYNSVYCEKVSKYSSSIDYLRHTYLQMGETAWKFIENESKDESKRHIINLYRSFVTQANERTVNFDEYFMFNGLLMWRLVQKDLLMANTLFDTFAIMLQRDEDIDERTAKDFAETVLDDENSPIENRLDTIYTIMIRESFYNHSIQALTDKICAVRTSPQQFLYMFYYDISITELKAYAMMEFSWMIRTIYGLEDMRAKSNEMRQQFDRRLTEAQHLLRQHLHKTDRKYWRCDAIHHIEGETYAQITRLLQGYLENEVDMNKDRTCWENCQSYQFAENFGCTKRSYCMQQQRCSGKILNCHSLSEDLRICPSKPDSSRRYEYFELDNGEVYGKRGVCTKGTGRAESWNKWLLFECSYCFCICDQQSSLSDRFINLREYVSNTAENKVVTGLRFRKKNRIIHLQIQEGQLLERGRINESSMEWQPLIEYKINDKGIRNDVDYHTLTWEKRAIDLDDVTLPDNPTHVVTGVRFQLIGSHLNLAVRFTEANFLTGKLTDTDTSSSWTFNHNTEASDEKRTKITFNNPDIPSASSMRSVIDSHSNQFVEFDHSDRKLDAAQSTIPFIDIQDVVTNPPVPLTGVGIYHKGRDFSGGFIAPKLITYDITPHIIKEHIPNVIKR